MWCRRDVRLLLMLVSVTVGCAPAPKKVVDFDSAIQEVQSIAVMQTDFTLSQQGAFSAELASEMKYDIEVELKAAVEAIVSESHYKLLACDLSDSVLAANPPLQAVLFEQNSKLQAASEDLHKAEGDTIDVDFGGNLDTLADLTGAEHFLFVRGSGFFSTTGGEIVAGLLAGLFGSSQPVQSLNLEGFLIDVNRGKVLWYHAVKGDNKDPRKPRDLLSVAQKLMKPLLGPSKLKGDSSRDHVITDKYKDRTISQPRKES